MSYFTRRTLFATVTVFGGKVIPAILAIMILVAVGCGTNGTSSPPAPRLGAIEGTVTDGSGEPVPTVRVLIVGGTADFPEIAPETDKKGFYRIGGVNPGTFEVAFHDRNGNRIGLDSVTVISGETSRLDLHIVVSHGGPVTDFVSVVDNLRAVGATVDPGDTVTQPFFDPQGQLLIVNGEDVQVFEFASTEEAATAASTVSTDGSSIGTSIITWIAPPHFYHGGKLIAIYIGIDSGVINTLNDTMGSQFAGR